MNVKTTKLICILIIITLLVLSIYCSTHATFTMSYLFGNYDYISLVKRTNGIVNEVAPSYFDLNEDGSLSLNNVDSNLITNMHKQGVTVTPFLSNHWDRNKGRKALQSREKLVTEIIDAIQKYNFDGVNVDLENLTESDKENYSDFLRILKNKLPYGKTLSVAVAANPNGLTTGWQGSYDYETLGKYADYIMVMTYDEHYEGDEAGPVASISFVEKSIQYALKWVPSQKIVLGIPFYGRYWNLSTRRGWIWGYH